MAQPPSPPRARIGLAWMAAALVAHGASGLSTTTPGKKIWSSGVDEWCGAGGAGLVGSREGAARRTVTSGDFNFYPSSASLGDTSGAGAGLAGSIATLPSLDPDLWSLLPVDPFGARLKKAQPRKLLDQGGQDSIKIDLTQEEEELFELLRTVTTECGMKTTLRVAGGWVRDKILASNEFERSTASACFDNADGLCGLGDSPEISVASSTALGKKALSVTVPVDIDIALDDKLGREFADELNGWLSTHGRETHSVGLVQENPEKSKHLETATMQVNNYWIDFVNLRAEEYASDSRIPELMRIGTPLEDALRRDLTINSLFYNVNTGEVEDMTGRGLDDLRSGIVATPLAPLATLLDDPLRVLRSVRFAARLGFGMEDSLRRACADGRVRTALEQKVSRERVGSEVDLMLKGCDPVRAMRLLVNLGLIETVFPLPKNDVAFGGGSNGARTGGGPFGGVHREGLALLGTAQDYLCGNKAKAPLWCEAKLVLEAGAVNGAGEDDARVLTEDEHARRLLWYAAFLKPLRDRALPNEEASESEPRKKPRRARRSVLLRLLVDEMKRPIQEAELVEKIMRAADRFTQLMSAGGGISANLILLSGASVINARGDGSPDNPPIVCIMGNRALDPDEEDDPVWTHCMQFRKRCGELLREIGPLWRAAFVLSLCEELRASETRGYNVEYMFGGGSVQEAPEEVLGGIIRGYDLFAAAMIQLGLIGIWNQRPLLDGNEVKRSILPNLPSGPVFRDVMHSQMRWTTAHPGGSREGLAEHLRGAFPEFC